MLANAARRFLPRLDETDYLVLIGQTLLPRALQQCVPDLGVEARGLFQRFAAYYHQLVL